MSYSNSMTVLPSTEIGKKSVELFAVFLCAFILLQLLVMLGQGGGETLSDNLFSGNWLLVSVGVIGDISALIAGPLGLISILKNKERSFLVFITTSVSFLVLVYMLDKAYIFFR